MKESGIKLTSRGGDTLQKVLRPLANIAAAMTKGPIQNFAQGSIYANREGNENTYFDASDASKNAFCG